MLIISVTCVAETNISINEEVPNLVFKIKVWVFGFENLFNIRTFGIPTL